VAHSAAGTLASYSTVLYRTVHSIVEIDHDANESQRGAAIIDHDVNR